MTLDAANGCQLDALPNEPVLPAEVSSTDSSFLAGSLRDPDSPWRLFIQYPASALRPGCASGRFSGKARQGLRRKTTAELLRPVPGLPEFSLTRRTAEAPARARMRSRLRTRVLEERRNNAMDPAAPPLSAARPGRRLIAKTLN